MARQKKQVGRGLIEVVGGSLRTPVYIDGKRRYVSVVKHYNQRENTRYRAADLLERLTDAALYQLALEVHRCTLEAKPEPEPEPEPLPKWNPTTPIGEWVEEVISRKRDEGRGESQLINFAWAGRILCHVAGKSTPIGKIPPEFGIEYRRRLVGQDPALHALSQANRQSANWSNTTINNLLKWSGTFFVSAVKAKMIPENPLRGVKVRQEKSGPAPIQVSRELAERMVGGILARESPKIGRSIRNGSNEAWAAAVVLGRFGGLRMSEILALPVERLDLDGKKYGTPTASVRNTKTIDVAGNRKEYREVPLCSYAVEVLRLALATLPDDCRFVVNPLRIKSKNTLGKLFAIHKLEGVEPFPETFQNFRRSFANDLANRVPMHVCAEIMGHSMEVAAQYYLQTSAEHLRAAADIGPTTTPALRLAQ